MTTAESSLQRPGLHHIALTVTDLEKSIPWYQQVFSLQTMMSYEHDGGEGHLLTDDSFGLVIVLHRHDVNDGKPFSERFNGLDHVGFGVPTRAELVQWTDKLETLGVKRVDVADKPLTQSPIADEPYGSVLVFRDPDNIQLEFFAPPGT
jgi:glyoxylase I family protein